MHSHAKTSAEIDDNLLEIAVSFLLLFLRKSRGEVLKKKSVLTFSGVERLGLSLSERGAVSCGDIVGGSLESAGASPAVSCASRNRHRELFSGRAEKTGRGARAPPILVADRYSPSATFSLFPLATPEAS
jgi:hypothetical protein